MLCTSHWLERSRQGAYSQLWCVVVATFKRADTVQLDEPEPVCESDVTLRWRPPPQSRQTARASRANASGYIYPRRELLNAIATLSSRPPSPRPTRQTRYRPLVSPPVAKLPVSSSLPRPPARPRRPQLVVSRSPIASAPVPLLSVRSAGTRSPRSSSSASSPSSGWFVRLHKTSRPTSASSPPPSWPFRRPPRPTSSRSSRTPTLRRSMPSV
ncbi:hypothetical protein C2E23DRAFT_224128 [Lenzites betulinus]|nr:hypothetical protein C2E23DRAFT_224128 [Lenzites betulinus]